MNSATFVSPRIVVSFTAANSLQIESNKNIWYTVVLFAGSQRLKETKVKATGINNVILEFNNVTEALVLYSGGDVIAKNPYLSPDYLSSISENDLTYVPALDSSSKVLKIDLSFMDKMKRSLNTLAKKLSGNLYYLLGAVAGSILVAYIANYCLNCVIPVWALNRVSDFHNKQIQKVIVNGLIPSEAYKRPLAIKTETEDDKYTIEMSPYDFEDYVKYKVLKDGGVGDRSFIEKKFDDQIIKKADEGKTVEKALLKNQGSFTKLESPKKPETLGFHLE
jgi:hypothetical protein